MNQLKTKTVGEILTENFLASNIFNKHGIDILSQGTRTLAEACSQRALNVGYIEQEIQKTEGIRTHNFNAWELDYLIDYILNNHHYFIWVNLPVIKEYALKVARMQGENYPVTIEVNRLFKKLATDLEHHLSEQEYQLFPYIKQLVFAKRDRKKNTSGNFNLTEYNLEAENQYFAAKLKRIVSLLSDSEIPNIPETSAAVLLFKLKAFQNDFYQHVHLEKNILFCKAMKLEKKLVKV